MTAAGRWLRDEGIPFGLITNTTLMTAAELTAVLGRGGLDVRPHEMITAPVATAAYLRQHHAGERCYLLGQADLRGDMQGVEFVESDASVVVVAGADDAFTFANLNRALGMLVRGAALVSIHRNLTWMTADVLESVAELPALLARLRR